MGVSRFLDVRGSFFFFWNSMVMPGRPQEFSGLARNPVELLGCCETCLVISRHFLKDSEDLRGFPATFGICLMFCDKTLGVFGSSQEG